MSPPVPAPVTVCFVLLPGSLILDWAGPAEALRMANSLLRAAGQPEAFRLRFIGPKPEVPSSVGAMIANIEPLPEELPDSSWLVLVGQPGKTINVDRPEARALLRWLRGRRFEPQGVELMCVCAGALLAAHAGLLDGRRATTHHHHLDELRNTAPGCEVLSNRVFVQDGAVWTSAGVTTGIDLFLHRISALQLPGVHGPALAAQVAQSLVLALRRGPDDPELSPFLRHRDHLHPALHRVQDALAAAPTEDWPLARMADIACTSVRHLARLFAEHARIAPQDYLRELRLARARAALQAGHSVTQAAELSGFGSDQQLRRAWRKSEGMPPSQWKPRNAGSRNQRLSSAA